MEATGNAPSMLKRTGRVAEEKKKRNQTAAGHSKKCFPIHFESRGSSSSTKAHLDPIKIAILPVIVTHAALKMLSMEMIRISPMMVQLWK